MLTNNYDILRDGTIVFYYDNNAPYFIDSDRFNEADWYDHLRGKGLDGGVICDAFIKASSKFNDIESQKQALRTVLRFLELHDKEYYHQ